MENIIIEDIENLIDISQNAISGITNFADIDIEDMIKKIIEQFI